MPHTARSPRLFELTWPDVQAHIARDSRLIVPLGTCDQYGAHLPLGAGTLIAEAVAEELARDFDVLRAPTIEYGVNVAGEQRFPGTAGLEEKSLHRLLNDLLGAWEASGFTEFILITAHRYDPHIDAIASVHARTARVRAVELLGMSLGDLMEGRSGREHGGEVMTSLMLHLYPKLVRMERAEDRVQPLVPVRRRPFSRPEPNPSGGLGEPSRASSETGKLIFEQMVQRVRAKVFLDPDEDP